MYRVFYYRKLMLVHIIHQQALLLRSSEVPYVERHATFSLDQEDVQSSYNFQQRNFQRIEDSKEHSIGLQHVLTSCISQILLNICQWLPRPVVAFSYGTISVLKQPHTPILSPKLCLLLLRLDYLAFGCASYRQVSQHKTEYLKIDFPCLLWKLNDKYP